MQHLITLKKRSQFKAIQERGEKWVTKSFIVLAFCVSPFESQYIEYGLITSRKLGCAVVRNRLRRRLKEVVREVLPHNIQQGCQYVFIARREMRHYSHMDLKKDMLWALTKLNQKLSENRHETSQ